MLLKNIIWIAVFGVVEFGIPWYLMATAEKHLTSSLTSLLICAVPLFSVVAQKIRRTEDRISARRYAGLLVGALGVALLVGLDLKGGSITWIGLMMIIAHWLHARTDHPRDQTDSRTRTSGRGGRDVLRGALLDSVVGDALAFAHLGRDLELCAVLSVVCTAAAFLVFFELVKEIGSTRSVVVTYVNTAIAVVLGIVGLGEPLTVGYRHRLPTGHRWFGLRDEQRAASRLRLRCRYWAATRT